MEVKDKILKKINERFNFFDSTFEVKDIALDNGVYFLGVIDEIEHWTTYNIETHCKISVYYKESDFYYNIYLDYQREDGIVLTKSVRSRKDRLEDNLRFKLIQDMRTIVWEYGRRVLDEAKVEYRKLHDHELYYIEGLTNK